MSVMFPFPPFLDVPLLFNLLVFNSLRDTVSFFVRMKNKFIQLQFLSPFRTIPYSIWSLMIYLLVFYNVIPLFSLDHLIKFGV